MTNKIPQTTPSLATRLTAAIGFILVLGAIIVTIAALTYGQQAARNAFDRLLIGAANQISASITIFDGAPLVDLPVTALDLLALAENDRIVYRVTDPSGATLTGNDTIEMPDVNADVTFFDGNFTGEPTRLVAVRRQFAERGFSGTVTTIVGHTIHARQDLAWDIARNALVMLVLAGIAMVLLAIFAIRSALAPLWRIEHELSIRDPKDLSPFDIAVPRELRATVGAINRFMNRLKRQIDIMQNLISDSAHQLRTPIAGLRAQAELALEEPDPVRQGEIVGRVHARSVGLSRLTDQMLSRAMIIHRADSAAHKTLDLRKIAMAAAEVFDDGTAFETGKLRLEMPDVPVLVTGDDLSLTEATKNLISNALHHGDGQVTIIVSADTARARLAVRDQGAGMSVDEATRFGERFLVRDPNRRQGTGIGLSIARAVAAAHRTDISIATSIGKGFEIGFTLPQLTEDTQ